MVTCKIGWRALLLWNNFWRQSKSVVYLDYGGLSIWKGSQLPISFSNHLQTQLPVSCTTHKITTTTTNNSGWWMMKDCTKTLLSLVLLCVIIIGFRLPDHIFPTETLRRGKKRGIPDHRTVWKWMLVKFFSPISWLKYTMHYCNNNIYNNSNN